ncbi:hypothetical protein EZV62_011048 [Acer yangbiense]|uniref:Retrotransposon gag domain-containing protein n=1 Tax=Acer yangbiense TaxID=1000413 RepID=A0A5C7I4P3_9ROSI|nr:hypothetical protein EZV62_011048 [Acer yangbiense]
MFLKTTNDIWDACRQTYSKVRDAAQIYDIKTKLSTTKHGTRSVTKYSNILQNLWQELDHYQCIEMKCTNDAIVLTRFLEKERIYIFLVGLNVELDVVRVQVLGKEDLPSLNETISIIHGEESRGGVMLESKHVEGSAMVVRGTRTGGADSQPKGYSSGLKSKPGWSKSPKIGSKNLVMCNYCRKPYHSRYRCWKLYGKPSNLQNSQMTNRTWTTKESQGQRHTSVV